MTKTYMGSNRYKYIFNNKKEIVLNDDEIKSILEDNHIVDDLNEEIIYKNNIIKDLEEQVCFLKTELSNK